MNIDEKNRKGGKWNNLNEYDSMTREMKESFSEEWELGEGRGRNIHSYKCEKK